MLTLKLPERSFRLGPPVLLLLGWEKGPTSQAVVESDMVSPEPHSLQAKPSSPSRSSQDPFLLQTRPQLRFPSPDSHQHLSLS